MQERADKIPRKKLQLVGVTSMFIAAKYEEMYAPEIGKPKKHFRILKTYHILHVSFLISIFYLNSKKVILCTSRIMRIRKHKFVQWNKTLWQY